MSTTASAAGETPDSDRTSLSSASTGSFLTAVGHEVGDAGLTAAALARAVVHVLPVDGAGLSTLVNVLRLPLGGSSHDARLAEELQTSLGEGPCLDAAEAQAVVVVDLDELRTRWELYGEELEAKTPFRSVASVPLSAPGYGVLGALDLYSTDPRLSDRLDHAQVEEVGRTAAALLTTCVGQINAAQDPGAGPGWYRDAAGRRHDVWVAIGMVMSARAGRASDALSLLRAHAYSTGRSLDDLAADIIADRLSLTDLTD